MPGPLTRAESKQRTRERLLSAAARVFGEHGYRGATVELIAAEAGYTSGALYSNFAGKDDLLIALIESHVQRVARRIVAAAGSEEKPMGKIRRGGREWIAFLDDEPDVYELLMELWTLVVRDPDLRRRHAERFGAVRVAIGELVESEAQRSGLALALPREQVGAAVIALADGLALQRLVNRDAVPDELLASLLAALVTALAREPART